MKMPRGNLSSWSGGYARRKTAPTYIPTDYFHELQAAYKSGYLKALANVENGIYSRPAAPENEHQMLVNDSVLLMFLGDLRR